MTFCRALTISLLLSLPGAASAQGPSPQGCAGTATTAAMQACEEQRYSIAHADLNAVYAKVSRQASPAIRGRLASAQAAWVRFRDADANYQAESAGGTMAPLLRISTLTNLTIARTAELRQGLQ